VLPLLRFYYMARDALRALRCGGCGCDGWGLPLPVLLLLLVLLFVLPLLLLVFFFFEDFFLADEEVLADTGWANVSSWNGLKASKPPPPLMRKPSSSINVEGPSLVGLLSKAFHELAKALLVSVAPKLARLVALLLDFKGLGLAGGCCCC
jgi:hypothetical protein